MRVQYLCKKVLASVSKGCMKVGLYDEIFFSQYFKMPLKLKMLEMKIIQILIYLPHVIVNSSKVLVKEHDIQTH